jgi:hypothetical protein
MLRIDRNGRSLKRLEHKPIPDAGLKERADIQQMIRSSPDEFFTEMGETLLLIGEEVRPAEVVDDRIDLLAIDDRGAVVVIELKRGSHKLQLLQALGYAAAIAQWEPDRLIELREQLAGKSALEVKEEYEEFMSDAEGTLNRTQRIILIAEDYDYMVLATAEWLTEKYGVDIRCYRLALSADGDQEYLTCTCIYPPAELAETAVRRGRSREPKAGKWADWDEALAAVENTSLVDFYRKELEKGRHCYLARRVLHYSSAGRRRIWLSARRKNAYAWQGGRFEDDIEFWKSRLSNPEEVKPMKEGQCLRFVLTAPEDFRRFGEAADGPFQKVRFRNNTDEASEADDNVH